MKIFTPVRLFAAVFLIFLLTPQFAGAESRTRGFKELNFSFAPPDSSWTWMEPPPGARCALSDNRGRMIFITVEEMRGDGRSELDSAAVKEFEDGFFATDEIEKTGSTFFKLAGVPAWQASIKFKKDGRAGLIRILRKDNLLYRFDVFAPQGVGDNAISMSALLEHFELLPAATLAASGEACRDGACPFLNSPGFVAGFVAAFLLLVLLLSARRKKETPTNTPDGSDGAVGKNNDKPSEQ